MWLDTGKAVYQMQMQTAMIVVGTQTVFGTAETGWSEGADCCGREDQRKVVACAEKF